MTTYLYDLFDGVLFHEMLAGGYVKIQSHPDHRDIKIANYTAKAQYDNVWNPVTKQCRGLVYSTAEDSYLQVVSRPFPKFFNVGQLQDHEIPQEPFEVFEKMDGSLGVLYTPDDGESWAIATRGSFTSDQAKWATEFLQPWLSRFYPDPELTYLFEIIYPENRIVVDYGQLRTLVLLDILETDTGKSVMSEAQGDWRAWPGRQVDQWDGFDALEDLLRYDDEVPKVTDREGFVIRFESGMRAKVKLDEYVRLHRILTNVSTRDVYRMLAVQSMRAEGFDDKTIARSLGISVEDAAKTPTLDQIVDQVPDEFYAWLQARVKEYTERYQMTLDSIRRDFGFVVKEVDSRAAFAAKVQELPTADAYRGALFQLYDGRSPAPTLWKALMPEYGKPFWNTNEDTN